MFSFSWRKLIATIGFFLAGGALTYYFYHRESTSPNTKPPKLADLTNVLSGPQGDDGAKGSEEAQAHHESASPH
ncbi:hypothetical protein [Corynebacterium pyruviciproducens]|uniref:Uncharacterized protein n=2 Tax=Corynebacterium pyruviciproducens TaxID=598660 RepID=S2Z206_9CORY|nr:hypothetical protein [Corynebacterium pyruviciproducens]EPD68300.1 hypothetical protein HMPREF1219_01946 [Corynebacterium pyruviciproducens ATCC BAA-1742]MDH4658707.1 hypothetical protein [Corynebacterium pyruviciproducens]MDK7214216.1 hypothetical protein [Corynebacterium pyruviciproducens]WOT01948.1 hypothetical protein CYJ47_11970 [Corynebacterium pyruviciproducens]